MLPPDPTGFTATFENEPVGTVTALENFGAGAPVLTLATPQGHTIILPYSQQAIEKVEGTTLILTPFAQGFFGLNVVKPKEQKKPSRFPRKSKEKPEV